MPPLACSTGSRICRFPPSSTPRPLKNRNFTSSAAGRNSENVMVVWKNPDLARGYLAHWQDRFNKGEEFRTNY